MKKRRLMISIMTVFALFIIAAAAGGSPAGRIPAQALNSKVFDAADALLANQKNLGGDYINAAKENELADGQPETENTRPEGADTTQSGNQITENEKPELQKPEAAGETGNAEDENVGLEDQGESGQPENSDGENTKAENQGESGNTEAEDKEDIKESGNSNQQETDTKGTKDEKTDEQDQPDESAESGEPEEVFQFNYAVAKVNEYVNIREAAGTDSEAVGKLYKNSYAKILERGEEWTKVSSGSVTGYIKNEYLSFDAAAVRVLQNAGALLAEVNAGTVNLRTGPGTDTAIIKEVKKGDTFVEEPEASVPGWTAVRYEDTIAYLSAQFVTEKITFKTAVSKAEEEEAAAQAALAKALEEAKKYTPEQTSRAAVELSDEDLFLLAVVVEMEAASESYEGKLAVANVVINRLVSGKWGSTLSSVVYAPNQFSGANSGRIETYSARVTESSKKAAVAAAAGENNIGDYMYFIMKSSAKYSNYSKYYILGNHCFYAR